jgi:hypothetical protein
LAAAGGLGAIFVDTHLIARSVAANKPKRDDGILGPFSAWSAAGFTIDLLPIAPPGVEVFLKDGSKISDGKMPAYKGTDGKWYGLRKWTDPKRVVMKEPRVGDEWGANLGLQGRAYPMLDLDIENKEIADEIEKIARRVLGDAPVRSRTDASARRLLLYRGKEAGNYIRAEFEGPEGDRHAVEFLGAGRQAVVEGRHKKKGHYTWDKHPCELRPKGLTEITKEQVSEFFNELRNYLELIDYKIVPWSGSSTAQPRMALDAPGRAAPSPEHVLEAMKCKPNDFETHDEFVAAAASLKVAFGRDREQYYGDFEQWAIEGWPDNTPDYVRTVWDSIRESSLGWDWFEGLARGKGYTGAAQEAFKDDPPAEYMPEPEPPPAKSPVLSPAPTIFGDPATIPMRQWIYDRHYIRRFLSATIAPGGVGKTKLIIAEVLAMVTGKNLLGVPVAAPVRVLYWNLEDPLDELLRQFQAAMKFHGITNEDIGGRLVVRSARDYRGLKIATDDRGAVKLNEPVIAALRQQIIDTGADVVILEPFVSIHSVSENDNNKIDEVCKVLNELAEQCDCAIETAHHTRKLNGSQTEIGADDGRGASAMGTPRDRCASLTSCRRTKRNGRL